jgi:hypothetical protein
MPHQTIGRGKPKKKKALFLENLFIVHTCKLLHFSSWQSVHYLCTFRFMIKFGLTLKCNFIFFWSHGHCWGCHLIRARNLELWLQTFVHWHYFDCCCSSTSHCCSSYNDPCYIKRRLQSLLMLEQYFKQEDHCCLTSEQLLWCTCYLLPETGFVFMNFCSDVSSNNIGGVLPNQLPPSIQNLWAHVILHPPSLKLFQNVKFSQFVSHKKINSSLLALANVQDPCKESFDWQPTLLTWPIAWPNHSVSTLF